MIRSLYTAATGMDAQQTRMDTIANNLANAGTTGFKKSRADFEDLLYETLRRPKEATSAGAAPAAPLQVGLGVRTATTTRSFEAGDLQITNEAFDVAIAGDGFLRVQRPSGEIAYTRAGQLAKDADGRLITRAGLRVEPAITIPQDAVSVKIGLDGQMTAEMPDTATPLELGRLDLATFVNPAGLMALGGNLYAETVASGGPTILRPGEQGAGALRQGELETSNVKAVEEMVAMIATQRSYELNSKVIQTADQMLQKLTNLR